MPDPTRLLEAMAASAVASCVIWLLLALPWKTSSPTRIRLGWVWGVAIGSAIGLWILDFRPSWPPQVDQDRFLLLVFPAAVLIESLAAVAQLPRWLRWLPRIALGAVAARLLLHGSTYLCDVNGAGTREWTDKQAMQVLAAVAAVLVLVWIALALLQMRTLSRSIPLAVSMALSAAGVAVMLTGYFTGGELALPLSTALLGAVAASCIALVRDLRASSIGIALVGLFSVLVVGRFFSSLKTEQALLLFLAPLLCWLPELPGLRRLWPWAAGILRLILVAVPLAFVLVQAQKESTKETETSSGQNQPSYQDYLNFGK
jgi:hypothetical protein